LGNEGPVVDEEKSAQTHAHTSHSTKTTQTTIIIVKLGNISDTYRAPFSGHTHQNIKDRLGDIAPILRTCAQHGVNQRQQLIKRPK
jgi:hypothetical protein